LGFFFVPAGIGLINSLDVLKGELGAIVGASVGSTIIIIAVTGWVYQLVRKATSRRNKNDINLSQE
ncbi:MAG: CidA/LrgA family protein, partial [Muribaculaceae bacterium]|nr:CidA/LrgA family protein [Muribaculaceae bacterium]